MKKMTKKQAMESIVEYVLTDEQLGYESYVDYCQENEWNPYDIQGEEQRNHVYAQALIAFGRDFEDLDGSFCDESEEATV